MLKLSHPDKILFPQGNISKRRLANYYTRITPIILPYLADRPLTLKQFPKGVDQPGFFRKHAPDYFPDYVKRVSVPRVDRTLDPVMMATVDEVADLQYFANQNVVELHATTATSKNLKVPDQLVFDLDPSDSDFNKVRMVALALKDMLDAYQIPSYVKLSGSRGAHVHLPIKPELPYPPLKLWTQKVAQQLIVQYPQLVTMEHMVSKRQDRVYLDILRNDYTQTVVAPYSVRALPGAPIAAPIDWPTLSKSSSHAQLVKIGNVAQRLRNKGDAWEGFSAQAVSAKAFPFLDLG